MASETTETELAPRDDPREVAQERATGTIDLDGSGAGSHTVTLSGDLDAVGVGLFGAATADDGTATLSSLTAGSVTIDVSGGTADATGVAWELTVSEDRFGV